MDDDGDTFADCLDDECANTLFCAAPASLVLNEVSIRSADQAEEFIEVYNRGDAPVDLTGAVVSLLEGPAGGASTPYAAIALDGLSLQPGEYLLLHDAGLVAPPGVVSLPFDGAADTDHLRQTEETGAIALHVSGGGLVDALVYDGLPSFLLVEDVSYAPTNYFVPVTESATTPDSLARIPNGELGSPDSIWRVTTSVTLGDANQVSAGTEDCTNGVDDDDPDTDVDCADAECDGAACGANGVECLAGTCSCPGGLLEDDCTNGVDDDCDGDVDCADPSCGGTPACAEICGNGIDDLDDDPDVDCADSECAGTPACAEICDNGVDDADLDLDVDCADSECALGTLCQEICTNGVDDADVDALADCADPECAGLPYCDEICTNGIDDPDVDGLADCADPECAGLLLLRRDLRQRRRRPRRRRPHRLRRPGVRRAGLRRVRADVQLGGVRVPHRRDGSLQRRGGQRLRRPRGLRRPELRRLLRRDLLERDRRHRPRPPRRLPGHGRLSERRLLRPLR
jgi:hypothetical protein